MAFLIILGQGVFLTYHKFELRLNGVPCRLDHREHTVMYARTQTYIQKYSFHPCCDGLHMLHSKSQHY